MWQWINDPIHMFRELANNFHKALDERMSLLSRVLGWTGLLVAINILSFFILKFAEFCERVRRIVGYIWMMPALILLRRFMTWLWGQATGQRKDRGRGKDVAALMEQIKKLQEAVDKRGSPRATGWNQDGWRRFERYSDKPRDMDERRR